MVYNHAVQSMSPVVAARAAAIPPGGCVRNLPKHLLPRRFRKPGYFKKVNNGNSIYRRLTMDGVAPTLLASAGNDSVLIHPVLDRFITLRERARLQTFPDVYEFIGPYGAIHRQIGNAVPVLFARQLASCLKDW